MQDAPYLLEACAQGFTNEEDQVQLALLSAAMKLFFKRPPECQQLLGVTLAAASAESSQDVHDRALLYYRSAFVTVGMHLRHDIRLVLSLRVSGNASVIA